MRRLGLALVGAVCLVLAPPGDAQVVRGAGGEEHAFVLLTSPLPSGQGSVTQLYHLPAAAPPGTVLRAQGHAMGVAPERIAARGEALVMVFPPTPVSAATGQSVRAVRRVTVAEGPIEGAYAYLPAGRQEALPPLPGIGSLLGLEASGAGLVALIQQGGRETGTRLYQLRGGRWEFVETPGDYALSPGDALRLVPDPDGFFLAAHGERGAALWRFDGERWERRATALRRSDDEALLSGRQTLAVWRGANQETRVDAIWGGERRAIGAFAEAPSDSAFFATGEHIAAAWLAREGDEPASLRLEMISSVTGERVYAGPPIRAAPVGQREIQLLSVFLVGVMLMALLFVLRPDAKALASARVPAGRTLATPLQRLMAALIDMSVGVGVSMALLGATLTDAVLLPTADGGGSLGAALLTGGVWVAHSVVGEWRWGRTIGKAIAGCETVTVDGRRPSLRAALLRNAIKAAPFLAALMMLDPLRRHPGDLIAGTLVVRTPDGGEAMGETTEGGGG